MNTEKIDFVLTYLDANDVVWQASKNSYSPGENADVNPNRYREWDNLKFFFRGIEQFAPWMHKIHVVTVGHLPEWLNLNHPKLNIVRHEDYIPEQWLPTFSSRCIDMNLHRIERLSEKFVYFNDDMFLIAPTTPSDFFVNGLPCDSAVMSPQAFRYTDGIKMYMAPLVDTAVINKHFNKKMTIRQNFSKFINLKYGKELLRSLSLMMYPNFIGFYISHLPYSYLKQTYQTVWKQESDLLSQACAHRFREAMDVNHWIFSYWQLATGQFSPRKSSFGKCYQIHDVSDAKKAAAAIEAQKYKVVCVNDGIGSNGDFDQIVRIVNGALQEIFSKKSSFEV